MACIRHPKSVTRKKLISGSRIQIQGPKKHRILDPESDPQHWSGLKNLDTGKLEISICNMPVSVPDTRSVEYGRNV